MYEFFQKREGKNVQIFYHVRNDFFYQICVTFVILVIPLFIQVHFPMEKGKKTFKYFTLFVTIFDTNLTFYSWIFEPLSP